jgi:hypothetical protein
MWSDCQCQDLAIWPFGATMLMPKSPNSSCLMKILFLVAEQKQKPNVKKLDAHPARAQTRPENEN